MPANKPARSPEADLAFLRSIVEGSDRPSLTLGVCYLAGGALYGLQCLFHLGQVYGVIAWPALVNLAFVIAISVAVCATIVWAVMVDRKNGARGPMASRTVEAAFSAGGMVNAAMVIVFAIGSWRDGDFATWLYYPAVVFGLQSAAWYVAWSLRKKLWMLATSIFGWLTAVGLGLTVREPTLYLMICTTALFLFFALPGWIMVRQTRARMAEA